MLTLIGTHTGTETLPQTHTNTHTHTDCAFHRLTITGWGGYPLEP
jgi:hypothetical protein